MTTDRSVALVVGAGPGLGAALARCFAGAGMDVGVVARNAAPLADICRDVEAKGVRGLAYGCDATEEADVEALFRRVEADLGTADLVVYNAGLYSPGSILDIRASDLERSWRVCCLGGFLVGSEAARALMARQRAGGAGGTLLFTGATASLRGSAGFACLAVGKFGLRALAQSMARELGPKGIHVAHVVIDAMIAGPRSRENTVADAHADPEAIAATYLALHRQARSAWTHELDLRPWIERF
jgi:NAD(P)-dependent dehydrogenase (short-subunit alcohol dehydrogenase family)